ncbi:hypothetical protein KR093_009241 [Drosophila rubida]|uniref:Gustatory receptor n=1 Tax=Drosophila rubida TaxID=30044 RepID=A0AAD4PLS6_9MUSC|nr:hypothetical protein KR093_009241 [Drosophila rubida]
MQRTEVFISYFEAAHGVIQYYPDTRTGRLKQSKFLKVYSFIHNLLLACGIPLTILDTLTENPEIVTRMPSNWVEIGNSFFVILHAIVITSTIYCIRFQQHSIQLMMKKLQKLKQITPTVAGQKYLYGLLYKKLIIIGINIIIQIQWDYLRHPSTISIKTIYVLYSCWTYNITFAMALLTYEILWKMYYCGIGLKSHLEEMLARQVQHHELHEFFKRQQVLISVCSEFNGTFRQLMLWYPAQALWTSILGGYLFIRIQMKDPFSEMVQINLFTYIFIEFAKFYALNSMAGIVADLIPETISVFRESKPQDLQVERTINLMSLQLNCQNTQVKIFGTASLNKRLTFLIMSAIILNTFTLIQTDYTFF